MCGFHLELIMKMVYDVFFILHNMEFSDGLDLIKNCPAYFEYLVKTLSRCLVQQSYSVSSSFMQEPWQLRCVKD